MLQAWWFLGGALIGVLLALFAARLAIRRSVRRALRAERRAREAERLAEIGSMTSGLAHEIKNPLSTIGLNVQLLGEGLEELEIPADERERFVRRVASLGREVERLREILEDFLRFAGEFRLEPRPVDLAETVREFADFFEPQADQQGVRLVVESDAPVSAHADPDAVKQALLNLALNAVQAMSDQPDDPERRRGRRLVIRAERGVDPEQPIDDGAAAIISVADEGPGVPAERREEIFRPYMTNRRGGAGLGLAITRRIVAEHGGRLWVEDNEPRGARFVIALPLEEGRRDSRS